MKHALIIEDNALIALMIRDYLEECGYDSVDLASTQGEAIQLAEQRCPDLITADDSLEHGSGVEAIRHICRGKAIPVIFIGCRSIERGKNATKCPLVVKTLLRGSAGESNPSGRKSPSRFPDLAMSLEGVESRR